MNRRNNFLLLLIFFLAVGAIIVDWPQNPSNYLPNVVPWPQNQGIHVLGLDVQGFRLGLDLHGGSFLLLQADLSKLPAGTDVNTAMDGAQRVIENRVNGLGVSEATVQRSGSDRLIVELPGIKNIEEAKNLIGQTAQLRFCDQETVTDISTADICGTPAPSGNSQWVVVKGPGSDGTQKELTGQYLVSAQ